jgi:hypothetical protein
LGKSKPFGIIAFKLSSGVGEGGAVDVVQIEFGCVSIFFSSELL